MVKFCSAPPSPVFAGGASKLLEELDGPEKEAGVEWIKRTYAQNDVDNNGLIKYVMGVLV